MLRSVVPIVSVLGGIVHGQVPECPNGLSVQPTRATVYPNGRVSMPFRALCNGQAWANGFPGALCAPDANYNLLDGGQVVSIDEAKWCIRPEYVQTEALVMVLVDTSNSIASKNSIAGCGARGCLEILKDAVTQFVNTLRSNIPGTAAGSDLGLEVKIAAFDGRAGIQTVSDWTYNSGNLVQGLTALSCGAQFCLDPSTNLHGALAAASTDLADRAAGRNVQSAFLVFFTDGTDQARRLSQSQAIARLQQPITSTGIPSGLALTVNGVGVVGETTGAQTGISVDALTALTLGIPGNVHQAQSFAALNTQFVNAANNIRVSSQSYYAVDYCTPRRSGVNNQLQLQYVGGGVVQTIPLVLGSYDASQLGATPTDNVVGCESEICPCTPAPTMQCPVPCIHPQTGTQLGPLIPGYPNQFGGVPIPVPVPVPGGIPNPIPVPVPGPPVPVPVPVGATGPCPAQTVQYVPAPAPVNGLATGRNCNCNNDDDDSSGGSSSWWITSAIMITVAGLLLIGTVALYAMLRKEKRKTKQLEEQVAAQRMYVGSNPAQFVSPPQYSYPGSYPGGSYPGTGY